MIANLLRLIPARCRGELTGYALLSVISVLLRAASSVLLVPLLGTLFSPRPAGALSWLGLLTAATAGGWVVDMIVARVGYRIGFALVDEHPACDG